MPSLMHLALTMLCALLDLWVLVFVFTIWCSAVSLARQYPCHLINTGCNSAVASSTGPQRGVQCTVQFRRDALGAAASLPISPMTGGINGADTALSGKLIGTTDEWIILESRGEM